MSADLLRRAAKRLRSHVADLPERIEGDWEQDSSEIYAGVMQEWVGECLADGGDEVSSYIALMHPPVALAVAGLLESTAEVHGDPPSPELANEIFPDELAIARAILREES